MTPASNPTWGGPREPRPGKRQGRPPAYPAGTEVQKVNVLLSRDEIAWLDAAAGAAGCTRSDVVRRMIAEKRT